MAGMTRLIETDWACDAENIKAVMQPDFREFVLNEKRAVKHNTPMLRGRALLPNHEYMQSVVKVRAGFFSLTQKMSSRYRGWRTCTDRNSMTPDGGSTISIARRIRVDANRGCWSPSCWSPASKVGIVSINLANALTNCEGLRISMTNVRMLWTTIQKCIDKNKVIDCSELTVIRTLHVIAINGTKVLNSSSSFPSSSRTKPDLPWQTVSADDVSSHHDGASEHARRKRR
jgi:hypothetical protein